MNKKTFFISLKIVVAFFLLSSTFYFYVEKAESAGAIEDPCQLKGTAKEEAAKYVKEYKNTARDVSEWEATIKEINVKKINDINKLSTIIELSLYNWACQNGYQLQNTQSLGSHYVKKNSKTNQGIFIGIKADGYLSFQGMRKGRASLALDVRGRSMETYYLQVVISKLNPDPNEKYGTGLDDAAQKILNNIVDFSYDWGLEYYSSMIIEQAKKK